MKKAYFKLSENDPESLHYTVERTVRFEEIDPLGIVWHGRYAGYFEDARVALGQQYGIGYMDLYNNGIMAPIKNMHVDFIRPLKFQDQISIEGILHYTDASRINSEYIIRNHKGETAATGYTVQMMLNSSYELYLVQPDYYHHFCQKWKAGLL